jgi:predicted amidohydrolase YtcJ
MKFFCGIFVLLLAIPVQSLAAAADLIIINANVRTMAPAQPKAEAIAVSRGEIVAVGSTKSIAAMAGEGTKTIDAGGKLVIPGFNDAHVHFAAIGNLFSSIDLREVKSPKEFAERFARYTRFLPKGRWILGSGWDNRSWVPNDPPTRSMIDEVTPDNPVFVYNVDAKSALANSLALKVAGIDKDTRDPVNGMIFRDASGEPTGVLRGSAIAMVGNLVPANHMKNWPEVLETASNYAASLGVTSVTDTHSDDLDDDLRTLLRQGKLKTRVYDCITLSDWQKLATQGVKAATGNMMVRNGCVKFFAEDDNEGLAQLDRDVAGADKAGLQVAIHAIGEKPNELVLDVFEKTAKANGPRDRRFRVEHAHNARTEDLSRLVKLKAIASMQPWLFYGENGSTSDDYKKIFGLGTQVAFGSDASITNFNPLLGIYAAVTGKSAISVEQAVRAYTVGSAYAEFQEKSKGTIEVGKLADLVILSDDIFSIDESKIRGVRVETTIVGGKVVFQRDQ